MMRAIPSIRLLEYVMKSSYHLESFSENSQGYVSVADVLTRISAALAIIAMLPIYLSNILISLLLLSHPFKQNITSGLSGTSYVYPEFTKGFFKHALLLWLIAKGDMLWVGSPRDMKNLDQQFAHKKIGLVSLANLHRLTGLAIVDLTKDSIDQENFSFSQKLFLLIKYAIAKMIYGAATEEESDQFSLFGIGINNVTMDHAVSLLLASKDDKAAKTACFVNVNSFNLAHQNALLKSAINDADYVFADGSGTRIAAQRRGHRLLDNVNGTDLLPKLCERAQEEGKRIFLLGAKPGVADRAAINLVNRFPGLQVSGVHHGYFDQHNCQELIQKINTSNTDILLVAFGSPVQETFLQTYRTELQVNTAVAVGGLFDFFSGNISRAPIWMRELGLEWVWRLMKEPKAKFHRYVIGNPVFLFRCFFNNK